MSKSLFTADQIARTMLAGFNRHFASFQGITDGARDRFEAADWDAVQKASRERIYFYDDRVDETVADLQSKYQVCELNKKLWQHVKFLYVQLLFAHKQPELAETFYNSVFCRLFHRRYYNNDHIFVRPSVSTDYLDSDSSVYRSYYPGRYGVRNTIRVIISSFDFRLPFEDLGRDIAYLVRHLARCLPKGIRKARFNLHVNVLSPLFYRNKAAYLIGRIVSDPDVQPFIVPILNNEKGQLYIDTMLLQERDISAVFGFSRAYFMVRHETPSALVRFLQEILPGKSRADLYSSIGLQKQGKTDFYRDFLHHLNHSQDNLVIAPGIRGMVMMVFTLPSYPYVFKIIKDTFAPPKKKSRQTVREKYQLVKQHDRVGRMADSLEYSHVALPLERFEKTLFRELNDSCAGSMEIEGEWVVLRHLYIERRMVPLNIYLGFANEQEVEAVVRGYGEAIKQMAAVNIFPGDMLYKNFGVTVNGRVVFYDYDEVCYMTECNFRHQPPNHYPDEEMTAKPWYAVAENDVFPESFAPFFMTHPKVRRYFMTHHADLLSLEFWQQKKLDILHGIHADVFPYADSLRYQQR